MDSDKLQQLEKDVQQLQQELQATQTRLQQVLHRLHSLQNGTPLPPILPTFQNQHTHPHFRWRILSGCG
jgi:hypothetical protein